MKPRPAYILPLIVFAQFSGTSLWFAGNAILPDLRAEGNDLSLGWMTSMVQLGFIAGTLFYAIFSLSDRYRPSLVFFISTLIAALSNLLILFFYSSETLTALLRFSTGFFLAGIYPVGMKIASDWYREGLGKALGYLLGALVLGTAFPHLLKGGYFLLQWETVIFFTSALASCGAVLVLIFVGEGPGHQKNNEGFRVNNIVRIFREKNLRASALGYFGHMWELYALWAFIPVILSYHAATGRDVSLWSFIIIAVGSLSCIAGGYISARAGNAKVAFIALLISGVCCLVSGFLFQAHSYLFLSFMILWGMAVIADSPQFSTLVARSAPQQLKGTSLSLITSIGFSITIGSIALLETLIAQGILSIRWVFTILAIGPMLGLISMTALFKHTKRSTGS